MRLFRSRRDDPHSGRDGDRGRAGGRDRGQAALEFVGVVTFLLVAGLAAIQLGIAAFAMQQAGTAARAAARAASYDDGDAQAAGRAAVNGSLNVTIGVSGGEEVTATATVPIPSILPLFNLPDARRTATMPHD